MGQARLLVCGTPGQMVELIEWTDFVKYLRRAARGACRPPEVGCRRRVNEYG